MTCKQHIVPEKILQLQASTLVCLDTSTPSFRIPSGSQTWQEIHILIGNSSTNREVLLKTWYNVVTPNLRISKK